MKLKVEGHPELIKDSDTKAVITKDSPSYIERRKHRTNRLMQIQKSQEMEKSISSLQEEVSSLNNKMEEILSLLKSNRDSA